MKSDDLRARLERADSPEAFRDVAVAAVDALAAMELPLSMTLASGYYGAVSDAVVGLSEVIGLDVAVSVAKEAAAVLEQAVQESAAEEREAIAKWIHLVSADLAAAIRAGEHHSGRGPYVVRRNCAQG